MKQQGCIHLIAMLVAACGAFAVQAQTPFQTEVAPSWGWKPDEVNRYKDYLKPGKSRPPWSTAVVASPAAAPRPVEAKPGATAETPPAIKAYCQNIEDPALDARFLYQKSELQRLEGELKKSTSALETKIAEDQQWVQRRDEFINMADGTLVALLTKIRPDAAAAQLAGIDEAAAAALLLKLKPKISSAILDQMDSAKASRLISVMIGAARRPEKPASPETKQAAATPEAGKVQGTP
jgi:flagellar motility protein MotE (MotC chaperone)